MEITSSYISYSTKHLSFYSLYRRIKQGEVELFPLYKRGFIWSLRQQSEFIESIFLGLPTQPFWFEEHSDGRWVVLDGGQRIASIEYFVENKFKLRGLEILTQYNGFYFSELPPHLVMKLEDGYAFSVISLPSEVDAGLKAEMFKRLNTNGAQLSRQEIRNFINQGPSLDILRKCSDIFLDYFMMHTPNRLLKFNSIK